MCESTLKLKSEEESAWSPRKNETTKQTGGEGAQMPSDKSDKAVLWDCSKQSRVKPPNGLSNIPEHTHYSDCNKRGARVDLFAYDNTLIGNCSVFHAKTKRGPPL